MNDYDKFKLGMMHGLEFRGRSLDYLEKHSNEIISKLYGPERDMLLCSATVTLFDQVFDAMKLPKEYLLNENKVRLSMTIIGGNLDFYHEQKDGK